MTKNELDEGATFTPCLLKRLYIYSMAGRIREIAVLILD
jgi:hypothetical protein